MKHYQRFIEIPIGRLIVICDNEAIISIYFTNDVSMNDNNDHPLLLQLEKELGEYFMGKRTVFTLPLNPEGTTFQKAVWKTLQNISYGTSISYAEEAIRFGNPKAVRAVANANGKNPIAILIPCHRVIATGGGLGGYSGGLWRKEFLLALEKKSIKKV